MTIWPKRISCWIPKATKTHSEYGIGIAFPLQHWLHKRGSDTYIAYLVIYVVFPKSKCTDFLFKCLLDPPEITSYLLQSMTLGKQHNGSNVFSTEHSSTGSHFP